MHMSFHYKSLTTWPKENFLNICPRSLAVKGVREDHGVVKVVDHHVRPFLSNFSLLQFLCGTAVVA